MPILYVFFARTGKTIHEVDWVRLDQQGNLQSADDLGATDGDATKLIQSQQRSAASGVKIVFSDGNGPKQTLYYFSTNLADGSFHRSGFSAFLTSCGSLPIASSRAPPICCITRILPACGSFYSITARPSCRTIAVFRWPISKQRNGGFKRLGITLDRSQCLQISISLIWQSYFKVLVRSNSALDTGGARDQSNLLLAQSGSQLNSEEVTAQVQPDANAPVTTAPSARKTRKRVEGGGTRSLNCRIATVFPFCW